MRVVELYYRLLAITLVSLIAGDLYNGIWRVQTGELYPYRHIPIVPLYGPVGLAIEWTLLAALAVALWRGVRRGAALWLAALVVLASLTQHYSNHVTLLFIVLVFTASRPPVVDVDLGRPNMLLVRWQLGIVYVFTALNKVIAGYLDGTSMANLYDLLHNPLLPRAWFGPLFRPPGVVVLSYGIVGFELLAPLILSRWPRLGVLLVVGFHIGITVLMPGILPFGLVMVTMSVVYLYRPDAAAAQATMAVERASARQNGDCAIG